MKMSLGCYVEVQRKTILYKSARKLHCREESQGQFELKFYGIESDSRAKLLRFINSSYPNIHKKYGSMVNSRLKLIKQHTGDCGEF